MDSELEIVHAAYLGYERLEFFGNGPRAHELTEIVKQHALLAVGAGMIPIPGLDIAAVLANSLTMYARINGVLGISFSENALKSIASGVIAEVAGVVPGLVILGVAGALLKVIPGIGTLGGMAIAAAADVTIMYVIGKVYIKSLETLVARGNSLTEENLKQAAAETSRDKAFVKEVYAEGKNIAEAKNNL